MICGSLLFLLLFVFFADALLPGHILSPSEAILGTPFFSGAAPPGFTDSPNPLLFDQVYQFTPWRYFAWQSLQRWQLPLWNQYSLSGSPFLATMQAAVFYPINLLVTFLPFQVGFVWSAILRLWLAGILTYLLLRRYGLGIVSSLISGVSFMLCGFLIVWLGHPHANVAVWLPALILLSEWILQAKSKRELMRDVVLLALVVGVQFLGGHIETSVDILLAFGIYYLVRWVQIFRPTPLSNLLKVSRLIGPPALAVLLGTALAAVQLMPFLEWLPLSAELHLRTIRVFQVFPSTFWQNALSLPLLVFPNLYSNPAWGPRVAPFFPFGNYWWLPWGNYNEDTFYVGITTLILALIAILWLLRTDRMVKLWTIIGAVSLGLALRLPILDWINQLPGLALEPAERLKVVTSFSLCVLSGFGAELLLKAEFPVFVAVKRLWSRLNLAVIIAAALILIGAYVGLPAVKSRIIDYGRHQAQAEFAKRDVHSHSLDYYYAQVDQVYEQLASTYQLGAIGIYLPALFAAAGLTLASLAGRPATDSRRALTIALPMLVAVDLITFGHGYNPVVDAEHFYPATAGTGFLSNDNSLFRSTALQTDFLPDTQMIYGWSDIRGMDFPTYWYDRYVKIDPARLSNLSYAVLFSSADSPLLRVLNLKYVATTGADQADPPTGADTVKQSGTSTLWMLRTTQPRSFMVYESELAPDDERAVQLLQAAPDAVYRRVILSVQESEPQPGALTAPVGSSTSTVTPIKYTATDTSWRVHTSSIGYLVNSDSYYPGWQALVDGQPARLFRANLAFRAVQVPAGDHTVEFRYAPLSVALGALLSLGSMIVLAGVAIATTLYRGRSNAGATGS